MIQTPAALSHAITTQRLSDGSAPRSNHCAPTTPCWRQIKSDQVFARKVGTKAPINSFPRKFETAIKESVMKGIVAYFLGIPIVVIILLYVTGIF
ncbi:MAG: hypothetical protein CFE33_01990 [Pseudorhodobacter sp. PARRP1]|nr:MAG: hypothetical protein CFE33_01990 [Pseudorhodobacter sp. PARRP1]